MKNHRFYFKKLSSGFLQRIFTFTYEILLVIRKQIIDDLP